MITGDRCVRCPLVVVAAMNASPQRADDSAVAVVAAAGDVVVAEAEADDDV